MNLRRLPSLPHWLIPFPQLRINLTYLWRHGRLPNLRHPRRFTELVQRRKLADRDPALPILSGKITAKAHVRRILGEAWIIPTYWSGRTLPRHAAWPYPFILKASHGCNQNIVCRDLSDWERARAQAPKWLRSPYGLWLDEWAYRDIPRGFIVEPYLCEHGQSPVDYKLYVFGGRAMFIQVHLDRESDHRWMLFDRDWRQVSSAAKDRPSAPVSLKAMVSGAELIARRFDFARIDFYQIDGKPKFGEASFYPGSGLDPFDPPELDLELGRRWLAAQREPSAETVESGLRPEPA